MGRSTRSSYSRRGLAAGLLALSVSGCGGHSNVQFSSSGSSPPAAGVVIGVHGVTAFGTLLVIGFFGAASSDGASTFRIPDMDPSRRVNEQDCTRPIEDWSANLQCR